MQTCLIVYVGLTCAEVCKDAAQTLVVQHVNIEPARHRLSPSLDIVLPDDAGGRASSDLVSSGCWKGGREVQL